MTLRELDAVAKIDQLVGQSVVGQSNDKETTAMPRDTTLQDVHQPFQ